MTTQMRFQKYLCLAMLIMGALALAYAFCYASGGLTQLGQLVEPTNHTSKFIAAKGKEDATLFIDIQGFNDALMYCGIIMILLAVLLYITACNKRRNYYISNYVATGVCAGGNIVISLILMIMNGIWMGRFKNVDFASWKAWNAAGVEMWQEIYKDNPEQLTDAILGEYQHYSESTAWFAIGFVVYTLVIIASVLLILNLVWKIKLMQGEKQLLNGSSAVEGGVAV